MPNTSEIVQQGWLTKSPPAKGIFRPRWRKRWFVLRTGTFPNQFLLEYYSDESTKRLKGAINLDECEQLIGPLAVQEKHKHTFQLKTPSRIYYLSSDREYEMAKWVSSLCQVCLLKSVDEESERGIVYTRAGDENNAGQTESNNVQRREEVESDESSPNLSNKIHSGPYIPISECFSGKPIPKSEVGDVTYCNSSVFQFPPKVNWATHPSKRDTDSDATPTPTPTSADATSLNSASALAPPRPPKSKANGSPISISVTTPSSASAVTEPLTVDHEEAPDSSSTCSSLHSPPSSAGAVYCNIAELTSEPKPRSSILSCGPVKRNQNIPPPVVDRNLKPLKRREGFEADRDRVSPTNNLPASYVSGTQTLPSRGGQYNRSNGFSAGPIIDRTIKPPDGTLSLGPTPAQIKSHGQSNQSLSASYNQKTLPSSPRRAGPIISPGNDKRPVVYHEYEQANEMRGTYMQIDCQVNKDAESPKPKTIKPGVARKGPGTPNSNDPNGFVEYRLIDPVKTKALNRTIEDREKQLRNNTLSKSHH